MFKKECQREVQIVGLNKGIILRSSDDKDDIFFLSKLAKDLFNKLKER